KSESSPLWRAFSFCPLSLCTSKEKMDTEQTVKWQKAGDHEGRPCKEKKRAAKRALRVETAGL
ncbi:MAG: hypothetical protein IJP64_06595, partial [Oscillospiraceae bacterium]|nr:hypothetical protein [Oscillospiraceae bacterium]